MLDNLLNLVRENAQDAIVNNTDVPNEHNEDAIQAASSSIFDVLKQQASSGNLGGLADMFKGGGAGGGAITQQVASVFTDKLKGFGIDAGIAQNLAASFIPGIIDKFTKKTADPNDSSFDLGNIVNSISGSDGKFQLSDLTNLMSEGQGGGLMDKLKGLF